MSKTANALAPAALLLLALSACANQAADQVAIACPPTQIAVPSDRIGHNNEDGELSFIATIDQLTSDCRVDENDVEVDIAFTMRAERGPGLGDDPVALNYYLATVDPSREIIDKQILDIQLAFEPEQAVSALRESVTLRLPASTEATGANYSLYIGFQPDQQPNR